MQQAQIQDKLEAKRKKKRHLNKHKIQEGTH